MLKAMLPCMKVINTQHKMCFDVFFIGMAIDAKVHHVYIIGNCVRCHSKICHVIGVVVFFIWDIVVHITQGFVMFNFVKKFHNFVQWHNIAFCERKKRFLLSVFHLINFLNSMFDHMVKNIPSTIS